MDSAPDAHEAQREIYARMGGAARLSIAFGLSDMARRIALAGIHHRHPEYTDQEVASAWARLALGDDLCREVWPDRPLVKP
jgi:hypothetical protein